MANTYADYTGDGSNTDFAITFDYIKTAHVAVEINDGPAGGTNKWVRKTLGAGADYTVVTSPAKKVVFNSAPANLVKVRVLRDSDANTGIVDFANGSVLTETELDNSYQHNRYLAEEAEEGKTGGALTKNETSGQFDADALRLENLADPDSDDDAVNKGYADNRYVDVAGDTMTGALDMGANKVTSSATPSSGNDLTNKTYTDATFVDVAGDTMSGELNMGSNKITNLADPTVDADAANKNYVDDTITTSLATGSPPPGVQLATAQIEDDAITYAKLQNVAANNVLLGNDNGAGVDVQELTAAEARTLLNVEDGATANDTDANLKNRANHTGTQTAATISDFDTEVANNTAVAANTAKVSNATHTGDATGDTALTLATVNSNVGSFTNANITVNAKGLVTAASNGSGGGAAGTPNWSSGWFNDTTGLSNGGTYTFTHNLGTTNLTFDLYISNSSSGTNPQSLVNDYAGGSGGVYGAVVTNITSTQITVQLGSSGYIDVSSTGTPSPSSFSGNYIKVVASASATVGGTPEIHSFHTAPILTLVSDKISVNEFSEGIDTTGSNATKIDQAVGDGGTFKMFKIPASGTCILEIDAALQDTDSGSGKSFRLDLISCTSETGVTKTSDGAVTMTTLVTGATTGASSTAGTRGSSRVKYQKVMANGTFFYLKVIRNGGAVSCDLTATVKVTTY